MITAEQQRVIESNLRQAGLIKGQGRGPIDSAPTDLSNWTTRLVIGTLCPLFVSLLRNALNTGTMHRHLESFHEFSDSFELRGTYE